MLKKIFTSLYRQTPSVPTVPDGVRVYAIGDIHGRLDLLRKLHEQIAADAASAPDRERLTVYLGDYIDRGLDSRGVIDTLIEAPLPDVGSIFLKGNHEEMLLRFLEDKSAGPAWLEYGGIATLYSYGVSPAGPIGDEATLVVLQRELRRSLPDPHLAFLRGLSPCHEIGGYFFAHAGIRPGVPLEAQAENDLLWIRNAFLNSRADHGRVVVHGHSIRLDVERRPNRIGIDTGAYATGRLTCLMLDGAEQRLIQIQG